MTWKSIIWCWWKPMTIKWALWQAIVPSRFYLTLKIHLQSTTSRVLKGRIRVYVWLWIKASKSLLIAKYHWECFCAWMWVVGSIKPGMECELVVRKKKDLKICILDHMAMLCGDGFGGRFVYVNERVRKYLPLMILSISSFVLEESKLFVWVDNQDIWGFYWFLKWVSWHWLRCYPDEAKCKWNELE